MIYASDRSTVSEKIAKIECLRLGKSWQRHFKFALNILVWKAEKYAGITKRNWHFCWVQQRDVNLSALMSRSQIQFLPQKKLQTEALIYSNTPIWCNGLIGIPLPHTHTHTSAQYLDGIKLFRVLYTNTHCVRPQLQFDINTQKHSWLEWTTDLTWMFSAHAGGKATRRERWGGGEEWGCGEILDRPC